MTKTQILESGIIKDYIGNIDMLDLHKTAFLCSRKIPGDVILKCHDWAVRMRDEGRCVISGFHSAIERDVLQCLLRGKQPLIIVLARGLKQKIEAELKTHLNNGRLLIISPFNKDIKRITAQTAIERNRLMIEIADSIVVGFCRPDGSISKLLQEVSKDVIFLR